jgi:CRISPR-associated exonuclease Cas4
MTRPWSFATDSFQSAPGPMIRWFKRREAANKTLPKAAWPPEPPRKPNSNSSERRGQVWIHGENVSRPFTSTLLEKKQMMYTEDELIPLSALQHLIFCERQCALIHVEQAWVENLFTAEGRIMHDRVDTGNKDSRGKVRMEYSMPLRSLRMGLIGKADVVEFHLLKDASSNEKWQPFPVEYKRGKPKKDNCDKVQLCAQALCLEEMLNTVIYEGALFYGKIRRRQDVEFDERLRQQTEDTAKRVHELIKAGKTPRPVYSKKCESCSFLELCLPKIIGKNRSVKRYLKNTLEK